MDCTDIKVLLSGLVDDEVDTDTRYRAERHLAECSACRAALDEAESLSQLMVLEAEHELAPAGLSNEFIGAVLEQTVHANDTSHHHFARWSNWIGWAAAAAALALAITIWVMDRRPGIETAPGAGAQVVVDTAPRRVRNTPLLISSVYDGDLPADTSAGSMMASGLRDDDVDALDSAALLLDMLLDRDAEPDANLAMIREMAEYNDVPARLEIARKSLDAHDRTAVLASELVIREILERKELPASALQDLRDAVDDSQLNRQLTTIVERWDFESRSL